jgi:hypothetical protein
LFWFCDFSDGINDFFDGSEDAFVLSNFNTVHFAELKLFYWLIEWQMWDLYGGRKRFCLCFCLELGAF